MKFSTDDLKKMFDKDKIGNWIVKYKRQVAAGCVLVCLVAAAAFSLGGKDAKAGGNADGGEVMSSAAEADMEAVEEAVAENVLEKNAYPEVNEIIQKYFDYIASGDMEGLTSITDVITDDVKNSILKSKDLVDSYQNIECYTKKGLGEGEYLVFACYEQNFISKISTPAPGMKAFYVCTGDDGLYIFNGEFTPEQEAFIEQMALEEDVIALKDEVRARYEEAKTADPELAKLEETANKSSDTEAQEPVEEEPSEEPEESSADTETADADEPADEPAEEPAVAANDGEATAVNEETRFTESVRLRAGRGTDTEYLGTAYQGESVTQIEDYSDGWSKISYNGKECYCMTEFLE